MIFNSNSRRVLKIHFKIINIVFYDTCPSDAYQRSQRFDVFTRPRCRAWPVGPRPLSASSRAENGLHMQPTPNGDEARSSLS
jgi:hypothetical protein